MDHFISVTKLNHNFASLTNTDQLAKLKKGIKEHSSHKIEVSKYMSSVEVESRKAVKVHFKKVLIYCALISISLITLIKM